MLTLYTMPMCKGCKDIKKLLKRWEIPFDEQPLLLWQNLHPGKTWEAPILDMSGNKYYTYNELRNKNELYRIVTEGKTPTSANKKRTCKINKNKRNQYNQGFTLTDEGKARINVTILRMVNGVDPYKIVRGWTDKEKEAAMIMWRLAQHNKASEMMLFAEMLKNAAKSADPYMVGKNGDAKNNQSVDALEE